MAKKRPRHRPGSLARVIVLASAALTLLLVVLMHGHNVTLFNPKGLIAHEETKLTIFAIVVLLTVAVPSVALFYFMAWKYRETNPKAVHDPEMQTGKVFMVAAWAIPTVFMAVLGVVVWQSAHSLAPQKMIASNVKPLVVEVVAMRWKWLFLYPVQKIATVNFVQMPVNTPVTFELTADDVPMSGFWVPNLGGMLYAMTGMVNNLNLMGQTPGDYVGKTAEINGAGYAGMLFTARVSSQKDFDSWVQDTQSSADVLDGPAYGRLLKPSQSNPPAFYSDYEPDLYAKVLMKYPMSMSSMPMPNMNMSGDSE